jgi:hypothetical protein
VSYALFGLRHSYPAWILGVCTAGNTNDRFVYGFFISAPQQQWGLLPVAGWINTVTSQNQGSDTYKSRCWSSTRTLSNQRAGARLFRLLYQAK